MSTPAHAPTAIIRCCTCGKVATMVSYDTDNLWRPVPMKMAANGWLHRTVNGTSIFACGKACAHLRAAESQYATGAT